MTIWRGEKKFPIRQAFTTGFLASEHHSCIDAIIKKTDIEQKIKDKEEKISEINDKLKELII